MVDGEIVIATPRGPRLRRAADAAPSGRVARREAREGDAGLVRRLRSARRRRAATSAATPQRERRATLEALLARRRAAAPPHAGDARSRARGRSGSTRFEGAGLDGVIAKPSDGTVRAGQARDAQDQARAHGRLRGRRLPLAQERDATRVGSLLLGLYDDERAAAARRRDVGVHDGAGARSSRRSSRRCASTRSTIIRGATGPIADGDATARMPGGQSRWSAGKDLSWEPLRIERVCEVKYDHLQGDRVPPRAPSSCAGGPTSARPTAATTSSRSRRLTSSRRSSAPGATAALTHAS